MTHYLIALAASFSSVLVRVFQYKNVTGGHYKTAFVNSYLMVALEMTVVGSIANEQSVEMWFWLALGGSTGACASMWLHDRYLGEKT